jgi:hypothetical protein
MKGKGKVPISLRLAIVVVAVAWILNKKAIKSRLLPFGSPRKSAMEDRPTYAAVDPSNDSLQLRRKLFTGPGTR